MFITAVGFIFLIKLRWPKTKSLYARAVYAWSINEMSTPLTYTTGVFLLVSKFTVERLDNNKAQIPFLLP